MANYKEYLTDTGSTVWKHFLRDEKGETAMCKIVDCKKILKTGGGSTKGLHTHLYSTHKISLKKMSTAASEEPPKKRATTIKNYFSKIDNEQKSLPAVLARLTALDGLSFGVLCYSSDLRAAISAMGFNNLPSSPNTICKMVLQYSQKIRNIVIEDIKGKKQTRGTPTHGGGEKFSLSFDEWTSLRNRRYININVHGQQSYLCSLGLIRVNGTMPAEKCIELLEQKLSLHSLNLHTDIVSLMTDGASVMKKIGKLLPVNQQLCFAHGIQLAVIDVLYKKIEIETEEQIESYQGVDEEYVTESDSESYEEQAHCGDGLLENTAGRPREVTNITVKPVITKVRKIVNLFRRSPTKNDDILQKYVREEFGKELSLINDCKTRWSSMLSMLERFYYLRSCIQKALIDVKSDKSLDLSLSSNEIEQISVIVNTLIPVRATVEALCRRDANLLTADIAIQYMINKLKNANNEFSRNLNEALIIRMTERRTELSGLMQYLHDGRHNIQGNCSSEIVTVPTANKCRKLIIDLLDRLNASSLGCSATTATTDSTCDEGVSGVDSLLTPSETVSASSYTLNLSVSDEINRAISKGLIVRQQPVRCESLYSKITKEMSLFENGGSRGDYLERVYSYLSTIKPTSVESERAFSSAGLLCTKIRNQLSDNTLDELCFLRSYFQQQRKLIEEKEK